MTTFYSKIFKGAVVLLAFCFTTAISAQVVSIQGTLKDASGAAVADGEYQVTFKLYDSDSGGAANEKWDETATVEVVGGIYSHRLGSVTPLDGDDFNSTLYLGVTVGNFELKPLTELTYAPYTLATAYASNSGQAVNADTAAIAFIAEVVECSGAVGDVKYSILNPTQFAAVNGDCWVPMNGGSMIGSALAGIIGGTTVPDLSGLFIRAQEYNEGNDPDRTTSSPIATLQGDQLQDHNHDYNDWFDSDPNNVPSGAFTRGATGGDEEPSGAGVPRLDIVKSTGGVDSGANSGSETRPKNMNFYAYIRIN